MARFLSDLVVTEIAGDSDKGRWRLEAPLIYWSDIADRVIYVPRGTVTDFASIPRLPFIFWVLGDRYRKPAVVHDYAYDMHFVTRATADAILREACRAVDDRRTVRKALAAWARRWAIWVGVRLFGFAHW